jgi:hypothetical protein
VTEVSDGLLQTRGGKQKCSNDFYIQASPMERALVTILETEERMQIELTAVIS